MYKYNHPYLSYQAGEHEDTDEKVGHLKGNLEDGYRLWKTPDVDQTTDSEVVTSYVPDVHRNTQSHSLRAERNIWLGCNCYN